MPQRTEEKKTSTPPDRAPIAYEKKDWSSADVGWGDTECLEYPVLGGDCGTCQAFEWVDSAVKMPGEYRSCAEQGFCMLLYRLASPGRLKDMMQVFGVSQSQNFKVLGMTLQGFYMRDSIRSYCGVIKGSH